MLIGARQLPVQAWGAKTPCGLGLAVGLGTALNTQLGGRYRVVGGEGAEANALAEAQAQREIGAGTGSADFSFHGACVCL
jgi:hypothetical protein